MLRKASAACGSEGPPQGNGVGAWALAKEGRRPLLSTRREERRMWKHASKQVAGFNHDGENSKKERCRLSRCHKSYPGRTAAVLESDRR